MTAESHSERDDATDADAANTPDDAGAVAQERSLLMELREVVVQRELELAQLVQSGRRFHTRYLSVVGVHQAELDAVQARIAQLRALAAPGDDALDAAAAEALRLAAEARRAVRDAQRDVDTHSDDLDDDPDLDPEERHERALQRAGKLKRLRAMFRELARRVHPDLALDDETREVRTEVMADVIAAYEAGDERRLRMMAEAYVELDGRGSPIGEVAPLRQMIVRMRLRLETLDQQVAEHKAGFLYHLARRADLVQREGGDLLADLAASMEADLDQARAELAELERQLGGPTQLGESDEAA